MIDHSAPQEPTDPTETSHIRKGRPGDWKNHLGANELELVDSIVPDEIRELVLRGEQWQRGSAQPSGPLRQIGSAFDEVASPF